MTGSLKERNTLVETSAVMELHAGLSQRAEIGLLLVPKMLQSIEVLQLASADLAQMIEVELAQNETLEVAQKEPEVVSESPSGAEVEDDWDAAPRRREAPSEPSGKHEFLANLPAASDALMEHIREQLAWWDLSPMLEDSVLALAEQLDERGYLACSETDLMGVVPGDLLREAVGVLRSLEPRGLGARDAVDALLMQLSVEDPDYADIRSLLTGHLEDLARNKIPHVARRMGLAVEDVQELLDRVRGFDPCPASRFRNEPVGSVRPDLVVRCVDGELEVLVNDTDLPSLGVSEDYTTMVKEAGVSDEVKRYLRPKLDSARDLIHAVEQRQKTLARVGSAVMHHQRPFLDSGASAIRPLKMSEIAEMLGLHTSTVSRAVAGKYVQTDRGVFLLRSFFDGRRSGSGDGSEAGGEAPGRLGIQEHIRQLVDSEAQDRPFSDDDLVALLSAKDIRVARRTVTKHRKELGIPSSWRRRKHGATGQRNGGNDDVR